MANHYHLIPANESTTLSIGTDDLRRWLQARWAGAQAREVTDAESIFALEFTVPVEVAGGSVWEVDGTLRRNHQDIRMRGDLEAVAEVVALLLQRMTPKEPLLMFDDSYSFNMTLAEPLPARAIALEVLRQDEGLRQREA